MLNKVEAYNPRGAMLSLPLQDVSEGFVVQNIDGLDPVKATISSTSFAQLDGEQFQASRREKRNIVMRLGLEPDYSSQTVSGLRDRLYQFFMPEAKVKLVFYRDAREPVYIEGYVESFSMALFSRDPAVDISIICMNPDFIENLDIVVPGTTINDGFDPIPLDIDYKGTTPTGLLFEIGFFRIASWWSFTNDTGDEVRDLFTYKQNTVPGDSIKVSSYVREKTVSLRSEATGTSSALHVITPESVWPRLVPGLNRIWVTTGGAPLSAQNFSITYNNLYGGL